MQAQNRILVVDDEKSIRFALAVYFRQNDFVVDAAADATEARELIAANDYALAIVDINLSGQTEAEEGLDLAAYLREEAPRTAVVILTGLETAESLRRAAEVGVRSFLRKPTRLAEVAHIAFDVLQERSSALPLALQS